MSELDEILDDLFHGCAWQAYLEQAALTGGPPDSEATRRRAYKLYEQALAERKDSDLQPPRNAASSGEQRKED